MSLVDEARAVRERITARLRELEPLVREYNELQQIAAQMGVEEGEPSWAPSQAISEPPAPVAGRSTARRPAARRRTGGRAARQGRGRSPSQHGAGGELAARVLAAARADPGKTVADYAEILGVAPTALYRPVRQLTSEGLLVKRARQLYPA